jgi:hypothetical protein
MPKILGDLRRRRRAGVRRVPASPAVVCRLLRPGTRLPPMVVAERSRTPDIPGIWCSPTPHYLLNERAGRLWFASTDPAVPRAPVIADFSDLNVRTSGGLLGMAIDPDFATNRLFYTCQTHRGPDDVRVVRWRLSLDGRRATVRFVVGHPVRNPLGCRLLILPDGPCSLGRGRGAGKRRSGSIAGGKGPARSTDGSSPRSIRGRARAARAGTSGTTATAISRPALRPEPPGLQREHGPGVG